MAIAILKEQSHQELGRWWSTSEITEDEQAEIASQM